MSHITSWWGLSRMNESCHIPKTHHSFQDYRTCYQQAHPIWMSHKWVISYLVEGKTHMNESCHTPKDIPLFHDYQTLLRHAHKYINESRSIRMRYVTCDTYEWVYHMHTWRINVYNVNMRIHVTCEWVMSYVNESCHVWMSHVMCNVSMRIHVTCECVT